MQSLLFKNACVVDGSGAPAFTADVLIRDGAICRVGRAPASTDARIVEADGKYLTPGFINMHSHGDCSIAMYPNAESSLGQGVTTEFAGHCGLGVAPVSRDWLYMFPEKRAFTQVMREPIGGINPYGFYTVPTDALRPAFEAAYGEALDWKSYGEFIAHLKRRGTGVNYALLAGQSPIRLQAMGLDYKRDATEAEICAMEASLNEAMDAGARGIGLGLDYQPSLYASRAELLRLMALTARRDGIVTAHTRHVPNAYYGYKTSFHAGLVEFLELGLESGARIHVSHIQNAYETAPESDAMVRAGVEETLKLLNDYRARGVRVSWDVIPKYAFGPFHYPMAASMFQPYVEQCGGVRAFARQLGTGNYRALIDAEIRGGNHASRGIFTRFDPKNGPDWDITRRITRAADERLVGKTLREAASGRDSLDFLFDLIERDPYASIIQLSRRPEHTPDRDAFVACADATIGLDTWTFDYAAQLNEGDLPLECGSPATYCGMTVFLQNELAAKHPVEASIQKLSGNAASCLGLRDRGYIREGCRADVLLIDPARFSPNECLSDPRRGALGLDLVLVNGEIAVENGVHTHVRSGRIL